MKKCDHFDDIDKLDELNIENEEYIYNAPMEEYLDPRRKAYRRDWQDYMEYYHYEDWSRGYDI